MVGLGAKGVGRAAQKEREAAMEEGHGTGNGWNGGGTLLTRPVESTPPYMPRATSQTRRDSGGASRISAPQTRRDDDDDDEE